MPHKVADGEQVFWLRRHAGGHRLGAGRVPRAAHGKRSLEQTAHRAETLGRSTWTARNVIDSTDAMDKADLIAVASPPCHVCGEPVQRVETRFHLDEDGRWRPGPFFMVCASDHRVLVEALE